MYKLIMFLILLPFMLPLLPVILLQDGGFKKFWEEI